MSADVQVKIKPSGSVQLLMLRRDAWGRVTERKSYTMPRRTLERALANATLEAPWAEVLAKR